MRTEVVTVWYAVCPTAQFEGEIKIGIQLSPYGKGFDSRKGQDFSLLSNAQVASGAHPEFYPTNTGVSFFWSKAARA
jgi:hypothetical protein